MKSSTNLLKYFFRGLFAVVLGLFSMGAAHAQIFQVTITGTLTLVSDTSSPPFFDFTVALGTPFTITYSLNSNAAPDPIAPGFENYLSTDTATLSFGDVVFSTVGTQTGISFDSTFFGTPSPAYGYTFLFDSPLISTGPSPYNPQPITLFAELLSSSPVVPNASLQSLQTLPLSDFDQRNLFELTLNYSNEVEIVGTPSSFSVEEIAVPEPSTWAMLLGGLGLLAFWCFRMHRVLI